MVQVPHDTVLQELQNIAKLSGKESEDMAMAVAVYMLGFNSYLGFSNLIEIDDNDYLKRIYDYAKGLDKS